MIGKRVVLFFLLAGIVILPSLRSSDLKGDSLIYYISMVNLINSPSDYKDKKVSLVGYLARESDPYLYLSKEHAFLSDISSGFPVFMRDLIASKCMNRFVRITGRFTLDSPNEFALTDISNIWIKRDTDQILVLCTGVD